MERVLRISKSDKQKTKEEKDLETKNVPLRIGRGRAKPGERYGGRAKGTKNKRSVDRLLMAQDAMSRSHRRQVPLEVMLRNMDHFQKAAEDADATLLELGPQKIENMDAKKRFQYVYAEVIKSVGLRLHAERCAADAAQFVHPKLSAVEGTLNHRYDFSQYSTDELIQLRQLMGRALQSPSLPGFGNRVEEARVPAAAAGNRESSSSSS